MPRGKKKSTTVENAPAEIQSVETPTSESQSASPTDTETTGKRMAGRPKGAKGKANKKLSVKPPKRYDPELKAKILAASEGKSIVDAHKAAQEIGYKGTAQSLYQMMRNSGVKGGTRRGRPKGSKNKLAAALGGRRPGRPAKVSLNFRGLSDVERIVQLEVESRLKAAQLAAITAFDSALKI